MTSPIAKAIAERLREQFRTQEYDTVNDIWHGLEAGRYDDLLQPPASWWRMVAVMRERLRAGESVESVAADYRVDVGVVAMLQDRPTLSNDLIGDLYEAALSDAWEHGAGDVLRCDKLSELYELTAAQPCNAQDTDKLLRQAAELRAWEEGRKP